MKHNKRPVGATGLSVRWRVEVDERGIERIRMRWTAAPSVPRKKQSGTR